MRKLILYVAVSKEGFIADENGGVDWLKGYGSEEEDYGYSEFMKRIDTLVMGNTTYEQVLTFGAWPYPGKKSVVVSRTRTNGPHASFTDNIQDIIALKLGTGKDIWLVGGAQLAQSLKEQIDEYIITIIPETLGTGIGLGIDLSSLKPISEKPYDDGVVQRTYTATESTNVLPIK